MVTGTVNGATAGEVRISAYDKDGNLGATTFTDKNGKYTLYVKDPSTSELVYYAGSQGLTGGIAFANRVASDIGTVTMPTNSIVLNLSALTTYVQGDMYENIDISGYKVTLKNKVTEEEVNYEPGMSLTLGTYTVTINDGEDKVFSGDVTITDTSNYIQLFVDSYEVTLEFVDEFSQPVTGQVTIVSDNGGVTYLLPSDGDVVLNLPKGDYVVSNLDNGDKVYFVDSPKFSVSSSTTKTLKVTSGKEFSLSSIPSGAAVTFANDQYRTTVVAGASAGVVLPVSNFGNTSYTVSYVLNDKVYYCIVGTDTKELSFTSKDAKNVSGTLKNSAGIETSGTIALYTTGGAMFRASADKEGKFNLYNVPKEDLFVYATSGTAEAYMGKLSSADVALDVTMEAADSINPSVRWDSISGKYLDVKVTNVKDLDGYTLYFAVNSSGNYKFLAPKSMSMKVSIELEGVMSFVTADKKYSKTSSIDLEIS
jgi:hypothetical protein